MSEIFKPEVAVEQNGNKPEILQYQKKFLKDEKDSVIKKSLGFVAAAALNSATVLSAGGAVVDATMAEAYNSQYIKFDQFLEGNKIFHESIDTARNKAWETTFYSNLILSAFPRKGKSQEENESSDNDQSSE